jgi:hypothetical protein
VAQPDPPPAPVQGQPLTPLDRFWLDTIRNAAKGSVGALEEAARQIIAIATFSQTIYFAAISFSGVKSALGQLPCDRQWLFAILLVVPIVLWLYSLWAAIRVFKPEVYRTNLNSPDLARDAYLAIAAYKHKHLQRAYIGLALGFIPLLVNVMTYLMLIPASPMKP